MPDKVTRELERGGARLLLRGPCEVDHTGVANLVSAGRSAGFAEVILRTNAITAKDPEEAARIARLGADSVLVPLFSAAAGVHDRIAGKHGALRDTIEGMRNLALAGMKVESEIPLLPSRLQKLPDTIGLACRAAPVRRVRIFLPLTVPRVLTPPNWRAGGRLLAEAIEYCRQSGIALRLSSEDAIPFCALIDFPHLQDVYAFNPRAKALRNPAMIFPTPCDRCAVREQCPGVVPSYVVAHGDSGLKPYDRKPAELYAQRTTKRRTWTEEQRRAAARAEILVLRPTVNCNQDCTFCSANETSANVWSDHQRMLRAITRAARRGLERVSFSGGEPTLSRHLPEYIRCASRLGVPKIEIVSNAVLLERPGKVQALAQAGLTHAFVSLHAHDETLSRRMTQKNGDFQATVRGIHNLLAAGVRTSTNHVITAQNYPFLSRYVDFVHSEFSGRVNISFAFVTPQFKALDTLDLMPRLSDVMPYLKRALYRALEIGQPFGIGSRQGIPFCFLGEFLAWSDGLKLSQSATSEDAHQKFKPSACDSCRFSAYCTGLWKPYVARYGTSEIQPIPGPPLTDKEVEEWMLETRKFPWGDPPSFEAVSKAFRATEMEKGPPEITAPPPIESDMLLQRTRPLRLVLIGSGRQARRLARGLQGVSGLSIDAVASPHAPETDLSEFGGCPAYSSAREAVEDIRPEGAIIAASTPAHLQLALLAIEQRVPCLLEKPIASTEEEARQILETARKHSVLVLPAHNSIHATGLEEMQVSAEEASVIRYVWRRTPGSRDTPRTWSRASLFETLYHAVALVSRGCSDEAPDIGDISYQGTAAPEQTRFQLKYLHRQVEILFDFNATLEEDLLSIETEDGAQSRRAWRRSGRTTTLQKGDRPTILEPKGSDVQRMLMNFRDVLLGQARPAATLEDAIGIMSTSRRIVEALADAGAPFERLGAPRHVATRAPHITL